MLILSKTTLFCTMLLVVVVHLARSSTQNSAITPEIVEKVSRSVVLIKGTTEDGTILGSGFLVSADGKIATNLHVVRQIKAGGVQLQSGEVYDAFSVLAFDARKDLVILQVAGFDLPAIELGNSNDVKVGESVIAIGSPRGLQGTVTAGIVSSIRDAPDSAGYKVMQTDAAANPGNSGGPLVNSRGQVVGVVTSKLRASEGLNFAVPINYVRGLMTTVGKPMTLDELRAVLNSSASAAPQRISVDGNVQEAKVSKRVSPPYPPLARSARISGVVRFNAIIGTDGRIKDLQLVTGHPLLVPAAYASVSQWVYKPTLRDGELVEVMTQIEVNFILQP